MNYVNAWKAGAKQKDKTSFELRFGKLTIIEISLDWSKKSWKFMLINFGLESTRKKSLLKG